MQRLERLVVAAQRAQRAAVHPEGRQPGGELVRGQAVECRGRLGERVRRRRVGGERARHGTARERRGRERRLAERAGVVARVAAVRLRVVERAGRERGEREREPQPDPVERRLRRQIGQRDLEPGARGVVLPQPPLLVREAHGEREALLGRRRRLGGEQGRARAGGVAGRGLRIGEPRVEPGAIGVRVGQQRQRGGEQLRGASGRRRAEPRGRLGQHRRRRVVAARGRLLDVVRPLHRPRAAPLELARGACVRTEPPPAGRADVDRVADHRVPEREPRGRGPGRTSARSSSSSSAASARSSGRSATAAASSAANGSPATAAPSSSRRASSPSAASSAARAAATGAGIASSAAATAGPPAPARASCSR